MYKKIVLLGIKDTHHEKFYVVAVDIDEILYNSLQTKISFSTDF